VSTTNIVPPFPVFTDSAGAPLDNGFVYVGTANLNPVSNPIAVYWDAALTVVAAQPLRTINGYLSQSGSPGTLFSAVDYSITVKDSKGVQVFTAPSGARAGLGSIVLAATESLTAQAGASIVLEDGSTMTVGTATGTPVTVTMASNARVIGDVLPNATGTQSLGSTARKWDAQLDVATVTTVNATTVNGTAVIGWNDDTTPDSQTELIGLDMNKCILASGYCDGSALVNAYNATAVESTTDGVGQYRITLAQAVPDECCVQITRRGTGSGQAGAGQAHGDVLAGSSGLTIRARLMTDIGGPPGVPTYANQAFSFLVVGPPRTKPTSPI
jgi:hypothetical protein